MQQEITFKELRNDALADKITEKLDGHYSKYEVLDVLTHLGSSIYELLLEGNNVRIPNFGAFKIRQNVPRDYFNITTGTYHHSHASFSMKFVLPKLKKIEIASVLKKKYVSEGLLAADYELDPQPKKPKKMPKQKLEI
jgi:nucleoid DNA-binding protein